MPAHDLLDNCLDIGERTAVGNGGEAVGADDRIELGLCARLDGRMEGHDEEEYKGGSECL